MTVFQVVASDCAAKTKVASAVRSVSADRGLSELMHAVEKGTPLFEGKFYGLDHDEVSSRFVAIMDTLELKGIKYELFQITKLPELTEPLRQQIERSYIENALARHEAISAKEDTIMELEEGYEDQL
jgi:hypothetical protein